MKRFYLIVILMVGFTISAAAQLSLPRESQRQEIVQTVGDARMAIVYHRPNTKARKVWGELVPFGKVWRTGANENTTFEVSRDVTINGQSLPAGKYGFHAIPDQKEWTLIFNKVNDAWGSFSYDESKDALRVKVIPAKTKDLQESLMYAFNSVTPNSAQVVLSWEKLRIPFTVSIGEVQARILAQIANAQKNRKGDDVRPLNQGANYVFTFKIKDKYDEALGWLDTSLGVRETFGTLVTKARLLAQAGRTADAIVVGEKAIIIGKNATPAAATADIEKYVAEWRTKK